MLRASGRATSWITVDAGESSEVAGVQSRANDYDGNAFWREVGGEDVGLSSCSSVLAKARAVGKV